LSNFDITSVNGSYTINKAPSTTAVTVSNATYDGNPHGGTANVTGASGLNQPVTVNYAGRNGTSYGPTITPPTNAGDYQARATFAGDDNHNGSQDSKPFSIFKADSTTVVSCPTNVTYNAAAQTPCSVSVTGAGGLNLTPNPGYTANMDAGTATASYTYAGDANHNGSSDSKTFNIDKAVLAVNAVANSKTYGDSDPAFGYSLSGFAGSDNAGNSGITGTGSCTRTAGETVAGSPYTITCVPGTLAAPNYSFVTGAIANFTINKKAASVTPSAAGKTYGSVDPTLTGTTSGFLTADGVTATYGRTTGETVLGSSYTISATLSPVGVLSNYEITYNTANFTINKKAASVTPTAASKLFGSPDPVLTGTLSGFLAADGVTATYSRTAGETVAGSPYTVTAILSPASVLSNYEITYNTANFTIAAWTLNGFYQPVDMSGVYNTVKGGSTVPLKFEIFAGGTELTTVSSVKTFVQTQITCSGTALFDDIELTTTGGTSLRYDSTGGQFIQNWQTPKTAGACYKVTMTTQDGSPLVAYFKLK
jgi:hypothetical protein